MEDDAFKLVKQVILAEDLVNELTQYNHHPDCPKNQFPPTDGGCNCGADKNNLRITEIKSLLDIQDLISFEK